MEFDKDELKEAVFAVYVWQYKDGDNFSAILCGLIQKSDPVNKAKLKTCFPYHVEALRLWEASKDGGSEFFAEYGIDAN